MSNISIQIETIHRRLELPMKLSQSPWRKDGGLSQEELAEAAGVHRTYAGMIERGEKNVAIYNIERIAVALGVRPGSLLD